MRTSSAFFMALVLLAGTPAIGAAETLYSLPERAGRTVSVKESQSGKLFPRLKFDSGRIAQKPVRKWRLPQDNNPGILYGTSVSRNEFGINGGVFPSPDSSKLAVYRKDESRVTEFPLLDIGSRTGTLRNVRYPMNGMASEHITLCVCDTLGNILNELKVTDFDDERYLTCVSWSPSGASIYVQVLDRTQHEMHLNQYDASTGDFVRTVLTESNDAWVEPDKQLQFITEDVFIYTTDNRDGYVSLYLCNSAGEIRRLTDVQADVDFVCLRGGYLYYTSAEVSPVENHLFRKSLKLGKTLAKARIGKPEHLTPARGWHNVAVREDCIVDRWSNFETPAVCVRRTLAGKVLDTLAVAANPLEDVAAPSMEFGTVSSADGQFDNYYRFFKPCNFDPSKKYPLIVYVYGGPHSQMVRDTWLGGIRMWELVMAQKGYAVYVQDNRGTSNRGAAFEKAINRRCGVAETEDQIAGLQALLDRCPWIDRDRIGVHGWSYGGFMTITMATRHPDLFKTAVAGGPVIDWKWYEVMYGERYMDTEATNPDGFAQTSLVDKAPNLKCRLLICQGAIDQTVVWEHSLSFTQSCIEAGIPLDYFPYPCDEHNMRGKARVHLYEKITDYFEQYL